MQPSGKVLVVDDREANLLVLREMLESGGYRVLAAANGPDAIEIAAAEQPGVVLLDVSMPGMDGFEVCRNLKAMAETAAIPVVFLTANYTEESDQLHGLELGAYDYLAKPVTLPMLLARVGVMLRIRRAEEKARQLSMVDEFTGLYSRRYVLDRLDEEMKRADRRKTSLVVAMLDLDDFKTCNDTFGHQFGDRVLRRVAAILKANVRRYDSLGRYGGEEFLLVQPEMPDEEAMAALERLQEKVAGEVFDQSGCQVRVSFSAGLAVWDGKAGAEELVRRADSALYAAKRAGKHQTLRYSEGLISGSASGAGKGETRRREAGFERTGEDVPRNGKEKHMKRTILGFAAAFLMLSAGISAAEVNCNQVNKYLATGRTVQDIAENMVISEEEVKKCQEQAQGGASGGAQAGGAAAPAGSAPSTGATGAEPSTGQ